MPYEEIVQWVTCYGSVALFFLLALGIFALPVPDETLMVLAGVLVSQGDLNTVPTVAASIAGPFCGISLSFLLGAYFGKFLIHHYGGMFGFTEAKQEKMHYWFERYGKWTLIFGYFIPGVRHLIGILSGMGKIAYPLFALFACIGVVLWSATFLSIGYVFGKEAVHLVETYEGSVDLYILAIIAIVGIAIAATWFIRKKLR
ncbi:MAG: DedA family protein [Verrucomicrobia bacterium]|nr:DedA family protein [Verrucomicrobiota bacterium]